MNDKIYPSIVIRTQAETIDLLEKENTKLQNNWNTLKDFLLELYFINPVENKYIKPILDKMVEFENDENNRK